MGGGWLPATYNYSGATTYPWVRSYELHGSADLRVYMCTDFTPADERTDYATDE